ncbi:flagellar motor switch protein FliN [Stratiformator vulcanicus]|uniref:Flagellar motor switch protein FliN n=1 Tax=Stratiformator vulcanicus TaxID=2527980 RepID=A0A517R582_9PLAN|nr:flagellar motor switch protein FliN [Stratiformator vulcanicus]QDT39048.1 Flagellar motor switch protein FliN [Stratiformator vulcanicus]
MADDGDDLLSPDEIEALLSSAGSDEAPAPSDGESPTDQAAPSDQVDPSEIEALFAKSGGDGGANANRGQPDQLLEQAEKDLREAVSPILNPESGVPAELGDPQQYQFTDFGAAQQASGADIVGLRGLGDVELDLRIELGRTELLIEEVTQLREGSVVPLDKLAGDPVDILVNGRLVARGEVLVLNDNFCVRVAEILIPTD